MLEGRNYRSTLEPEIMRCLALLSAALLSLPAAAQSYPTKPVRIIVPFAPGGGSDFIARFTAQRLSASFGSQVIVENKPGAGGMLGIEQGVRADPDGYTFTLIASSYTVNPALYPLKYDPVNDITPVVQISQGPMIVVVNPKVPANSATELIALAKAKPGTLNFASAGQGSITHMACELFAYMAGIKMNHIPYKGTGPALTDTIGGQTDLFCTSTATALPHVKAGRLRALAVTTANRLPAEPNVPTLAESGVKGYDVPLWHGLIAPRGMPKVAVDKMNAEVNKLLKSKDTAEQLQTDGVSPKGGTPEAFRDQIRNEVELWKKTVAATGVKPE
jgi:tripartite-type tricarboxylate transporter receptor subunit TctC